MIVELANLRKLQMAIPPEEVNMGEALRKVENKVVPGLQWNSPGILLSLKVDRLVKQLKDEFGWFEPCKGYEPWVNEIIDRTALEADRASVNRVQGVSYQVRVWFKDGRDKVFEQVNGQIVERDTESLRE